MKSKKIIETSWGVCAACMYIVRVFYCCVYIMFPAATAAPSLDAVVKTGCAVMGRERTGCAKMIVVDAVQDLTSPHVNSRFDHGGAAA